MEWLRYGARMTGNLHPMIIRRDYFRRYRWHRWFAWRPVALDMSRTVWLQRVWRRRIEGVAGSMWEYRACDARPRDAEWTSKHIKESPC